MALSSAWLTLLVIVSNSLLESADAQSTRVKTSTDADVIEFLENLSKAVATLQTRLELQAIALSNLEAKADTQEVLLNYLVTTAGTQANLLNNLETKIHFQAKSLSNLEVQSNMQIHSLYKLEANLEVQAIALNNIVAKEKWQEPIAQSPVSRTFEALEGDDVEIWCVVHGTPLPEIRWARENGTLESDRLAVENNGKTLRIKKVQLNDEGSYVCVAANGVGAPATHSVSLEVYGKYRQCSGIFESDKGNLEVEPSNSSCLSVIKLKNTTGFRLELDPLMTESILVIPKQNTSNSNAQSIWINGSKNVSSHEFDGEELAIVVLPGRERMALNWRGLAANVSEIKSTTKFVNDSEGALEWEPIRNGSGKIFWEFSHEMPVELNWTLNTDSTAQDQENPCENMFFSVLQIRPDGNVSEIKRTCDGSSAGFLMLEGSSTVFVLLHIQSVEAASSKLRVSWMHPDEPLKKLVVGIVAGTDSDGAFVVPLSSGQTNAVTSGNIYGLTFDWNSQKIYYLKNQVGLMRSNLDGSESKILFADSSSSLCGLTIEPTTGNFYYGNRTSRTIRVCNNDATKCSTIANSSNLDQVYDVAIHRSKGLLFWSIYNKIVVRANLDGSNATVVMEGRSVHGIDVDEREDRLYWGAGSGLGSCDLNGQAIQMLTSVSIYVPDVAIDNDRVYYSDWYGESVHVISKSGTNSRSVAQLTSYVRHINLFGTQVSNLPANPCEKSECAHLCVIVTRWSFCCVCPDNQKLNVDGKTCTV